MNEEEVMIEVKSDISNTYPRVAKAHVKFRRAVIKAKVFPVRVCIKYTSPRKNRWIIFLTANNKKMIYGKFLISFFVLQNSDHGIYARTMLTEDNVCYFHIFPPHFFSRYAERCKINKNGEDLIIHFFENNDSLTTGKMDSRHGYDIVEGSCRDGIALGRITEHQNYLFRTFITRDLAKGNQLEHFKWLEDFHLDINEEL